MAAAAQGRWAAMYARKVMLAPMVRVGTLPTRLLSLKYGADLVYTEELIDHRMLTCKRVENPLLGTVDFVEPNGHVVLRTCRSERHAVIFQMGTSDPDRAVATAKLVAGDVAGIDVNMGCPKAFSIKGGMGAALLRAPEKASAILTALVRALPDTPVTCKIRLLGTEEETLSLVHTLVSTGIAAIGVHGRLQSQRPREPVSDEQIALIRKIASEIDIPVIANGGSLDIETHADVATFHEKCCTSSVMVARAAQWNPSVFRAGGALPLHDVCQEYLRLAARYDNAWENSKYCLMSMMKNQQLTPTGQALRTATGTRQMCEVFNIASDYDVIVATARDRAAELGLSHTRGRDEEEGDGDCDRAKKRPRVERIDDRDVTVMDLVHDHRAVVNGDNPKTQLINYSTKNGLPKPEYVTRPTADGKRWFSVCVAVGGRFASSEGDVNKRRAEQTAALICLTANNLLLNKDGTSKAAADPPESEPAGGAAAPGPVAGTVAS